MSEGETHKPGEAGGWYGRGPGDVDENEFVDSDETTDIDELVGPENGLAVSNALSGDCAKLGGVGLGRRGGYESEKCEKAQPVASNEVQKSGKVKLEEDPEGSTETGTEREGNERREGEGVLWEEKEETEDVEEGLEGIAEEPEDNGNKFGDDDEGVDGNPKEV